jgi:two-component system sensor histidine kinase MprB
MELNWASHFRSAGTEGTAHAMPSNFWPETPGQPEPSDQPGATDPPGETDPPRAIDRPEAAQSREPPPLGAGRLGWLRHVSFRTRISALVAAAVGVAVALGALGSYVAVSRQINQQVTSSLQQAVDEVPSHVRIFGPAIDGQPFLELQLQTGDQIQILADTGGMQPWAVVPRLGTVVQETFFKVTPTAQQVYGSHPDAEAIQTLTGADGNPYQVATVNVIPGQLAVQIGYPLSSVNSTLSYLRLVLILVAIGGVVLAGTLGWAVGRASMRPVEDLTLAAEHVAETQDLSSTIDDTSKDELGRLARSFNAMLAALSASRQQQAQLVSDAGHELRTPLTSLRTNIEFLMRAKDLAGPERDELLADVDAQLQELTTLVGDLVDLAREDERPEACPEPVGLDHIVERAVERAQRRAMSVNFDVSLEPGLVLAQPGMLERAIMNVLDNAAKWSPPGGRVGVTLRANRDTWHLTVTDEGPGISPEDLPHIFDRFYRAPTARSMPGSGLGLAIAKRVVTSHGGRIEVTSPPGSGTKVEITLPLPEAPLPEAPLPEAPLPEAPSPGAADAQAPNGMAPPATDSQG